MNYILDNWIYVNNITDCDVPTEEELNEIDIGYSVKISNGKERFWTEVIKITNHYIVGRIDNKLSFNKNYDYNDLVMFDKGNIFDIHDLEFKKMIIKYINNSNNFNSNNRKKNI
jgi:uncharacterized protein YegJ (DUF2314 family)